MITNRIKLNFAKCVKTVFFAHSKHRPIITYFNIKVVAKKSSLLGKQTIHTFFKKHFQPLFIHFFGKHLKMGLCAKNPCPVKMASLPFDVIAQWSDKQKSDLLHLLQDAEERVCRQKYEKDEMAARQQQALEVDKKRKKIDELKKIICELKETYTKACIDVDYDMIEWAEKQQAAFERENPELYYIARDEITRETQL